MNTPFDYSRATANDKRSRSFRWCVTETARISLERSFSRRDAPVVYSDNTGKIMHEFSVVMCA